MGSLHPRPDPTRAQGAAVALTAEAERQLLEHYRINSEAGRAAEIADHHATDVTAKPI